MAKPAYSVPMKDSLKKFVQSLEENGCDCGK